MIRVAALALVAALTATAAHAGPDISPLPEKRQTGERATPQEPGAVGLSPRPDDRPGNLRRKFAAAFAGFRAPVTPRSDRVDRKGRLCGSKTVRGEAAPTIPAKRPGCGLSGGVHVHSVDGVALSRPATMDCNTALALESWVQNGLKPAVDRAGGGVASLKVAAHYVCRTRNHRPGGPIPNMARARLSTSPPSRSRTARC